MQEERKTSRAAMLAVLLCAVMWSIGGIFIKLIPWNAFVIGGLRSLIAGTVAFSYMKIAKMPFLINKRTLSAGLALCATMTLFVLANKLTTAANAIVLQFTAPMFIVIFSALFLKKRAKREDVIAVLITMGGIALFFLDQLDGGRLVGNIVAIGAGMAFACYYMSLGASDLHERLSTIVLANAMTALIGLPFILTTQPVFEPRSILCILILGVVQLGVPYIILGRASEHCPPLACSLLGAAEPLLNPVWVFIFDGEHPGVFALLGGVIVVVTISLWCVVSNRNEKIGETQLAS